jgi:hypothetical protein
MSWSSFNRHFYYVTFEVFTAVLLRMVSSGMLRRVAPVSIDVSEALGASSIRVTRIGELGTALAVASQVPPKRRFLQEPRGVTSQKTPLFEIFTILNNTIFCTMGWIVPKTHQRALEKFLPPPLLLLLLLPSSPPPLPHMLLSLLIVIIIIIIRMCTVLLLVRW